MDEEAQEALAMSREELHRRATAGRPVPVAEAFYESDEDPAEIAAAFDRGEKAVTTRPAWMDKDDMDLTSEDLDAMIKEGTPVEIYGPAEIRIVP